MHDTSRFGDVLLNTAKIIFETHNGINATGEQNRRIGSAPQTACRRPTQIGLHWVVMAMWEMTITCHDGTRLRLSELRDPGPQNGDVVETLDTGQIRQNYFLREEKVGGSRPPFFSGHTDRNLRLTEVPLRFHSLRRDKTKEHRLTDKIYVDATRPATLNDEAGLQTDCPTLGEAVTAWQRLPPKQKIRATIKVIGGRFIRRVRSTDYIRARSSVKPRRFPPPPAGC